MNNFDRKSLKIYRIALFLHMVPLTMTAMLAGRVGMSATVIVTLIINISFALFSLYCYIKKRISIRQKTKDMKELRDRLNSICGDGKKEKPYVYLEHNLGDWEGWGLSGADMKEIFRGCKEEGHV